MASLSEFQILPLGETPVCVVQTQLEMARASLKSLTLTPNLYVHPTDRFFVAPYKDNKEEKIQPTTTLPSTPLPTSPCHLCPTRQPYPGSASSSCWTRPAFLFKGAPVSPFTVTNLYKYFQHTFHPWVAIGKR